MSAVKTVRKGFLTVSLCLCLGLSILRFLPLSAAAEPEIGAVLVTTSSTPVALTDVDRITAETKTEGCSVTSCKWFDLGTGEALYEQFSTRDCRAEIRLAAKEGDYFSEEPVIYLNGEEAKFVLEPGLQSLTIYQDYVPGTWLPTVIKNPGSETVDPGGLASFVSTAISYDSCEWSLTSPDGATSYSCAELPDKFPGLTTSEDGWEKMNLYNVPVELNGWRICCAFSGPGGTVKSEYADITVRNAEPFPAAAPSASPAPSPSASPSPAPEQGAEAEHVHEFDGDWDFDERLHWHACACGEKADEAEHDITWAVIALATKRAEGKERGICSVCGYIPSRPLAYEEANDRPDTMRLIICGVCALAALWLLALLISAVRRRGRRRRRRRRR